MNGATQDNIDQDIEEGGGGEEPEPPDTLNARVLTAPDGTYDTSFGSFANPGPRGLVGGTPDNDQIFAFAKVGGRLVSTAGGIDLPDFTGTQGDGALQGFEVTDGQSSHGPVSGTAYAEDDFAKVKAAGVMKVGTETEFAPFDYIDAGAHAGLNVDLFDEIGKELGVFTDPYQWYGRLADEMLRAMRLVVDTGLHYKGWTREQAIQYMLDNSSMAESDVVAEVEDTGDPPAGDVGEHGLERRQVAVDIRDEGDPLQGHPRIMPCGAAPPSP